MINYEQAKQLKDAGFPNSAWWDISDDDIKTIVPLPTLSELIKACGHAFQSLEHIRRDGEPISSLIGDDETLIFKAKCWEHERIGDTPEEAVAKLWLALNT